MDTAVGDPSKRVVSPSRLGVATLLVAERREESELFISGFVYVNDEKLLNSLAYVILASLLPSTKSKNTVGVCESRSGERAAQSYSRRIRFTELRFTLILHRSTFLCRVIAEDSHC